MIDTINKLTNIISNNANLSTIPTVITEEIHSITMKCFSFIHFMEDIIYNKYLNNNKITLKACN